MKQQTDFIPYEQAVQLKELGFNEECVFKYSIHRYDGIIYEITNGCKNFQLYKGSCTAPLYQQAFRWFREKYDFYAEIFVDDDKTFGFLISSFIKENELVRIDKPIKRQFATYEEGELECLKWLIDAIQRKSETYS